MIQINEAINQGFSKRKKDSICKKHNEKLIEILFKGKVIRGPYCQKCEEDKAFFEDKKRIESEVIEKEKVVCEKINNLLMKKIGRNYDFDIKNYIFCSNNVRNKYEEIVSFPKGLNAYYFYGSNGLGKTLLSKIILRKLAFDNKNNSLYTYKYVSFNDFSLEVYNTNLENRKNIIDNYKKYDIIVLDELGRIKIDNYIRSMLFSIIDYRLEGSIKDKITIFISNYSFADISSLEWFEQDRMKLFDKVEFIGKSKRGI